MKKSDQQAIRLSPAIKSAWEQLARETYKKDASVLAREVLEQFLACHLTDDKLVALGMVQHVGRRTGSWLETALRKGREISEQTPEVFGAQPRGKKK